MEKDLVEEYGHRVGYSDSEIEKFREGGHRIRHVKRLSQAAHLYSIEAQVVRSRN